MWWINNYNNKNEITKENEVYPVIAHPFSDSIEDKKYLKNTQRLKKEREILAEKKQSINQRLNISSNRIYHILFEIGISYVN